MSITQAYLDIANTCRSIDSTIKNAELNSNFSFLTDVGVYYLIPTVDRMDYKQVIPLEVHIRADKSKQVQALAKVDLFREGLCKKVMERGWFTPSLVFMIDSKDTEGILHYILNFNFNTNYGGK
jgi:hypothetical protein